MAIPGIYSPGQAAGVQLGGAITPQAVAQSVGQAQFATNTGIQDTQIGLNAIQNNGKQVAQYADRIGKTASMMADVGATIGKYLDDQSYRNEALAIAPIKALTTTIGLNRIASGDMGGYGDVTAATSMGAGNPFLSRMDSAATATANNLADNYTQNLMQQERQRWEGQLYGMQQQGRYDLKQMGYQNDAAGNQRALDAYQSVNGGGNPITAPSYQGDEGDQGIQDNSSPLPQSASPVPVSTQNGAGTPDQQRQYDEYYAQNPNERPEDQSSPDTTANPDAPANPDQSTSQMSFDDKLNVLSDHVDWSNKDDVKTLLSAPDDQIPSQVKLSLIEKAHKEGKLNDKFYDGIMKGVKTQFAVELSQKNPLTVDQANKVAESVGIDTIEMPKENVKTLGGIIGWVSPDTKGVKKTITQTTTPSYATLHVGKNTTTTVNPQKTSTKVTYTDKDDSGIPEPIRMNVRDIIDSTQTIHSNTEFSDGIKESGGIVAGNVRFREKTDNKQSNTRYTPYTIQGGEESNFKDADGKDISVSKYEKDAYEKAVSAIGNLKTNKQGEGSHFAFLRVAPGEADLEPKKPKDMQQDTWDTAVRQLKDKRAVQKIWNDNPPIDGKVNPSFQKTLDEAVNTSLDNRIKILTTEAQSDNASEDVINALNVAKRAKASLLQKQLNNLIKLRDRENSDQENQRKTSSDSVVSQPVFPARNQIASQYDSQIEEIQKQIEALK